MMDPASNLPFTPTSFGFTGSSPVVSPELLELEHVPEPQKVLVLEDDDIERDLLVRRLELLGLEVSTASSIAAAEASLDKCKFSLAIMDVHLPDGSGLDLCQRVIDSDKTHDLPVIILSSMRDGSIVRQSRAAGGMFFLGKPYDPNVLLAIIENAIGL